jgi:tRNA (guanine26-N2/guanine27-N2)-dimethyltransferase
MFKTITEGQTKINVPVGEKISHKLEVFYNPVMKFNRDTSVLFLNSIDKTNLKIADPLAGSGVRGVRFLVELCPKKIDAIHFNDYSAKATEIIKKNISLNKTHINCDNIEIHNKDANIFLLESNGFDYIDIDPFGTPNPFLSTAALRLSREGILAVTATDTSALCGTHTEACKRKYWAEPSHTPIMHEAGIRILIRKVQLVAAQFDRALEPSYCYSKDHYMRVIFTAKKSKKAVDQAIRQHDYVGDAGPMWTGKLWDEKIAKRMMEQSKKLDYQTDIRFLETISEESKINTIGFFDVHQTCRELSLHTVPKYKTILEAIHDAGRKAAITHFSPNGIRTDLEKKEFEKIVKTAAKT